MAKKSLKFYDVKDKKTFFTSKYTTENKMVRGRKRKWPSLLFWIKMENRRAK